ncbi:MAG: hypothetical protein ACXWHZ_15765 [Usitatibacter sp.]
MSCPHKHEELAPREFQIKRGASWLVKWCQRCGEMEFLASNPHRNEPMVDQPEAA